MMKKIFELADTVSDTSNISELAAKKWLNEIIKGAASKKYYEQVCKVFTMPAGHKDLVVPYKMNWLASWDVTSDEGGTQGEGYTVPYTTKDNLSGVTITPTPESVGIAISYHAIRTNSANLIADAKEDLQEWVASYTDDAVSADIVAAADASVSVKGMQTIYGGDAYSEGTLDAGDVLTTDLITDAKTRLKSKYCYYYDSSTWTKGIEKYPWVSEPSKPFVLFIAPEQEGDLEKDSQFTNASEYGSNDIVLNGEIGKYHGVKILSTTQTPAGTFNSLAGRRCHMVKSQVCAASVYGEKPRLHVFDYPRELEKDMVMEIAHGSDTIHDDAIVEIRVLDE